VRISATDWVGDDGVTPDEAVQIARMFAAGGADIIDVGGESTRPGATPVPHWAQCQ
jgi:anthraniloyl-CoA monooxygenase